MGKGASCHHLIEFYLIVAMNINFQTRACRLHGFTMMSTQISTIKLVLGAPVQPRAGLHVLAVVPSVNSFDMNSTLPKCSPYKIMLADA